MENRSPFLFQSLSTSSLTAAPKHSCHCGKSAGLAGSGLAGSGLARTGLTRKCSQCQRKPQTQQPRSPKQNLSSPQPPILHEVLNGREQLNNDDTERQTPPADSAPTPPQACVQPTSVRLVRTYRLEFPSDRTGGGICAVMEVLPAVDNLCPVGIREEVTNAASGSNCPTSLIQGMCSGNSTFTAGRNQTRICREVPIPATGFVDRHSVQVSDVSVLHDATRNPANLDSCTSVCHQRYFIHTGTTQATLGQFQIRYEFTKGRRGEQDVTNVTATKTVQP